MSRQKRGMVCRPELFTSQAVTANNNGKSSAHKKKTCEQLKMDRNVGAECLEGKGFFGMDRKGAGIVSKRRPGGGEPIREFTGRKLRRPKKEGEHRVSGRWATVGGGQR